MAVDFTWLAMRCPASVSQTWNNKSSPWQWSSSWKHPRYEDNQPAPKSWQPRDCAARGQQISGRTNMTNIRYDKYDKYHWWDDKYQVWLTNMTVEFILPAELTGLCSSERFERFETCLILCLCFVFTLDFAVSSTTTSIYLYLNHLPLDFIICCVLYL